MGASGAHTRAHAQPDIFRDRQRNALVPKPTAALARRVLTVGAALRHVQMLARLHRVAPRHHNCPCMCTVGHRPAAHDFNGQSRDRAPCVVAPDLCLPARRKSRSPQSGVVCSLDRDRNARCPTP